MWQDVAPHDVTRPYVLRDPIATRMTMLSTRAHVKSETGIPHQCVSFLSV